MMSCELNLDNSLPQLEPDPGASNGACRVILVVSGVVFRPAAKAASEHWSASKSYGFQKPALKGGRYHRTYTTWLNKHSWGFLHSSLSLPLMHPLDPRKLKFHIHLYPNPGLLSAPNAYPFSLPYVIPPISMPSTLRHLQPQQKLDLSIFCLPLLPYSLSLPPLRRRRVVILWLRAPAGESNAP